MLELLRDGWDLVATLLMSIWDILGSALNLVIIDDPFWRGVEFVVVVLLIWNNRKELIKLIDRVPLLGGLVARGLEMAERGAEMAIKKLSSLWSLIRSNTWDKAVNFILKADKDLRN